MQTVTLGSTGIIVNRNGFGALPIQRVSHDEAIKIIRRAYEGGMNFFDTGITYGDSEKKVGEALEGVREHVYLATKTKSTTVEGFWKDLYQSLENLRTDYIDVYQFHNPLVCPKPGDGIGLYEAAVAAKEKGLIRHIGVSNHRLKSAFECVESGLYEVLQFPFSCLAGEKDYELVEACKKANMGFVSMKALAGGLITNAKAAYAFQAQYDHVLPIWGIQKEEELEEFLALQDNPPTMNEEVLKVIEADKEFLKGDFCRGCGYCCPCPMGIEIHTCARMSVMIRKANTKAYLSEAWQKKMEHTKTCVECRQCISKCPYELPIPEMLKKNYEDYQKILAGEIIVE